MRALTPLPWRPYLVEVRYTVNIITLFMCKPFYEPGVNLLCDTDQRCCEQSSLP
ncbi:MAG TPA: hypothetical protein GXX73_03240 [Clostridium sp.]|nr:hypothetical protein [Clostridium sp.]